VRVVCADFPAILQPRDSTEGTIKVPRREEVPDGSRSKAAEEDVEKGSVSTKVFCPECGGDGPRRLERKGFMQMRVYPLFGYFPWTCPNCKSSFMLRKRHRRKSKRKKE